jgi:hypothetical protein
MLPRDIPMSRGGVPNAAVLGRASGQVTETPMGQPKRCTKQFVLSVARMLWFPSGPGATSPSTVEIASAPGAGVSLSDRIHIDALLCRN